MVIQRLLVASHSLQASRVIDMVYGAQKFAFFGPDFVDVQHERRRVVMLEIFMLEIGEDRRSKGTEPLAVLDARVENIFHIRQAGMSEDGAVAESAPAPLHASLQPADGIAGRDLLGHSLEQKYPSQ